MIYIYIYVYASSPNTKLGPYETCCYTKEFSWWPILWLSWPDLVPWNSGRVTWRRWFLRYKKKGLQRFPSSKVHFFRCTELHSNAAQGTDVCVLPRFSFLCHSHLGTNESCLGKCTGSSWLCMGQEAGWCKDLSGLVLCAAWPVALRNRHFASDLDRLGENQGSNRLTPRIS